MKTEINPNDDLILESSLEQNKTLDDIKQTSEIQADGLMQTNDKLDDLNMTAELILEGMTKTKEITPKVEIEVDGATIEVIEGPEGDKGEKGDKGDIGLTGPRGEKGEKGEQGPAGKDGLDGKDGVNGKDGKDGVDGKNGKDGKDGKNGKDGKDGKALSKTEIIKAIKENINFNDLKDSPDVSNIVERVNKISAKTISLSELDDVNLSGLTKTNEKYDLVNVGYVLPAMQGITTPVATAWYYVGYYAGVSSSGIPPTVYGMFNMYIPKTGKIKSLYLNVSNFGTLSSAHNSSITLYKNGVLVGTVFSNVTTTSTSYSASLTEQNIEVVEGDYIYYQFVSGAWTTAPTNLRVTIQTYVE